MQLVAMILTTDNNETKHITCLKIICSPITALNCVLSNGQLYQSPVQTVSVVKRLLTCYFNFALHFVQLQRLDDFITTINSFHGSSLNFISAQTLVNWHKIYRNNQIRLTNSSLGTIYYYYGLIHLQPYIITMIA